MFISYGDLGFSCLGTIRKSLTSRRREVHFTKISWLLCNNISLGPIQFIGGFISHSYLDSSSLNVEHFARFHDGCRERTDDSQGNSNRFSASLLCLTWIACPSSATIKEPRKTARSRLCEMMHEEIPEKRHDNGARRRASAGLAGLQRKLLRGMMRLGPRR